MSDFDTLVTTLKAQTLKMDGLIEAIKEDKGDDSSGSGSRRGSGLSAGGDLAGDYDRQAASTENLVEKLKDLKEARGGLERDDERQLKQSSERLEAIKAIQDARGDPRATKKARRNLENLTKAQEEANQQVDEGANIAERYSGKLFGLSGQFGEMYSKWLPKSIDSWKEFGLTMRENVFSMKGVTSGILKIADLFMSVAFAADEAQSKFRQNTGAGKEFNNNLSAVRNNLKQTGVGFDEAGKSLESLYGGMSSFTRMSDGMQTKVAGTVAVYDQLGVSMDVTTGIMDHAVQSLGYDAQGSMDLVKQLDDTAVSLGKNISDVFADFASASKKLSFYGTDMINVFRKLEMQSKDTGLSIDEILGLTEQFDTFEGAGKAVGKLNALLGGPYLNSIDMLNATEAERMEMMKEAMDMSGTMFSDLSKYEQKAFAAAMGTDVDTLRKAMVGLNSEEEEQIKVQEKAAKRAAEAKSAMEGLTLALQSLIEDNKDLTGGIMVGIRSFTEWITKFKEGHDVTLILKNVMIALVAVKVLSWLGSFISLMKKFKVMAGIVRGAQILWTAQTWLFTAAQTALTVAWNLSPFVLITAAVAGIALIIKHIMNLREAGMSWTDVLVDMGKKILVFSGPIGMLISFLGSFIHRLTQGQSAMDALKNSAVEFANNISFGGLGKLFGWGTNAERKAAQDQAATAKGLPSPKKITDGAILRSGQVTRIDDNDTVLAGRPGGGLAGALGQLMGGSMTGMLAGSSGMGKGANPILGFLSTLANAKQDRERAEIMQMYGPLLKTAITDPIVQALGGGTGDGAGGINVKVYIGQEEVDATVVKALNSPHGRSAMLPWSPGAPR